MSTAYGEKEVRIWIMGFGLALMLIGIALIASWGQNVLFISRWLLRHGAWNGSLGNWLRDLQVG